MGEGEAAERFQTENPPPFEGRSERPLKVSTLPTPPSVGYGVRAAQVHREGLGTAFIGCKDGTITRICSVSGTPSWERYRQEGRHPNRAITALCPASASCVLVGCADGVVEEWRLPPSSRDTEHTLRSVPKGSIRTVLDPGAPDRVPDKLGVSRGDEDRGAVSVIDRLRSTPTGDEYFVGWRREAPAIYRGPSASGSAGTPWLLIRQGAALDRLFRWAILARPVACDDPKRWVVVSATGRIATLRFDNGWRATEHASSVYRFGEPPMLIRDYTGARLRESAAEGSDILLLATDTGVWSVDLCDRDGPSAQPLHLPGFAGKCNAISLHRSDGHPRRWMLFANDELARAHVFTRVGDEWHSRGTTNEHGIQVVRALGFPRALGIVVVLSGHNSAARIMACEVAS
jgi:hypothetical protein